MVALALGLALPACADEEEPTAARSTGGESADSFNDMPDDGVNERSSGDAPARVASMRSDGDPYPEYILVDPAIPERRTAFELQRLEQVCGDPSVYFETDSAELSADSRETIAYLAHCVQRHEVRAITITGHADERASDGYNEALGQRRAEAVAELLQKHGVTEPQIRVESMGEQASRHHSLFWADERRVDIETAPADPG
ncbi:MAG: OmpA family protein [Deltaproteobacteria bacterium]|nr:OmpA family protein [Deltaproteobacteria bacterium]